MCSGQQQFFRVTPTDVHVGEGRTAVINCAVENRAGRVQWTKDGLTLGKKKGFFSSPCFMLWRHTFDTLSPALRLKVAWIVNNSMFFLSTFPLLQLSKDLFPFWNRENIIALYTIGWPKRKWLGKVHYCAGMTSAIFNLSTKVWSRRETFFAWFENSTNFKVNFFSLLFAIC